MHLKGSEVDKIASIAAFPFTQWKK